MSEASKDTIYIDVDDEITGIIDKITNSKHKIVALVLPKRAAVLQSIVNMKLLKRSGDSQKKKLVLITSEVGLLPLAGAVKLHVAKTLQSKPTIPAAPDVPSDDIALEDTHDSPGAAEAYEDEDIEETGDEPLDGSKPVGELASGKKAGAAAMAAAPIAPAQETIDLDDEPDEEAPDSKKSTKKGGGVKDKKLKIPNFEKFRTKLLLGGAALVLLIIGWYFANFVLPTAKITIKTDNISIDTSANFTANTAVKTFNAEDGSVPATQNQVKKSDAVKVTATGQKNEGEKATGTVTLKLTDCSQAQVTVPGGTVVTNGSLAFVTQSDVSFNSVIIGNKCQNNSFPSFTTATIKVTAQNAGDQYNISGGRSFAVKGFSNVAGTDSSAMAGGTNKNVTVVSQQDVDNAKQQLADKSKDAALSDLKKQFDSAQLFSLVETFGGDTPTITASPTVGSDATDVTVTSITNYSMLGVKREDLKTLVVNAAKKQIDTSKQSIADDGLSKAVFQVTDAKSPTQQTLKIQSTVSTGAQINGDALKKEIAGKKRGDVQDIIGNLPSVKEVLVSYSPFWVYKTPNNPSKITLIYEQAGNASSN